MTEDSIPRIIYKTLTRFMPYPSHGKANIDHLVVTDRVPDWDATYADIPNARHWHDKAQIAYLQLSNLVGDDDAQLWANANVTDQHTWKDAYEMLTARVKELLP